MRPQESKKTKAKTGIKLKLSKESFSDLDRSDDAVRGGATGRADTLRERLADGAGDENGPIDAALARLLQQKQSRRGFDLLYGLARLGVYALERLPRRAARTMLGLVVRHLVRMAEHQADGITWLTKPAGIAFTPRGSYSLGMAHGVPGVIALLARAVRAGVARREARALLEGAVPWLLAQRLPPDRDSAFPPWTYPGHEPIASRAAWCYGDPSIAAALFAAGQALRRDAWIGEALTLALRNAERSPASAGIRDATLCHGAAGLGHLLNRLYQATGDERLAVAARRWFAEALSYRRPGRGIAGFERYGTLHSRISEPRPDGTPPWFSDPGLLTGVVGIALALLAAATPIEPAWDRLLLVDLSPQRTWTDSYLPAPGVDRGLAPQDDAVKGGGTKFNDIPIKEPRRTHAVAKPENRKARLMEDER